MFQSILLKHLILCVYSVIVIAQSCGLQKIGKGLIVGGSYASAGAWPWFSALKFKDEDRFFCAGTLFTERHVLSGKFISNNFKRSLTVTP